MVAKAAGVHRTRVSNWKRPREDGGTGGRIPQNHIPALIELAREINVPLDHADFFASQAQVPAVGAEAQS